MEPSEDIKESYINKSFQTYNSAYILINHEQTDDAVALLYYSMYADSISKKDWY